MTHSPPRTPILKFWATSAGGSDGVPMDSDDESEEAAADVLESVGPSTAKDPGKHDRPLASSAQKYVPPAARTRTLDAAQGRMLVLHATHLHWLQHRDRQWSSLLCTSCMASW